MERVPRLRVIGVMGSARATPEEQARAYALGRLIALKGWVTLTGGEPAGVMHAALTGAREAGGLTLGILSGTRSSPLSPAVDIAVFTDSGNARNTFNILTSEVVILCSRLTPGTLTEASFALREEVPIVACGVPAEDVHFLTTHGVQDVVTTPEEAVAACVRILQV